MWTDPIVAEVRRIREEYAKRFDYDLDRIVDDLMRRQAERLAKEDADHAKTAAPRANRAGGRNKRNTAPKSKPKPATKPTRSRKKPTRRDH